MLCDSARSAVRDQIAALDTARPTIGMEVTEPVDLEQDTSRECKGPRKGHKGQIVKGECLAASCSVLEDLITPRPLEEPPQGQEGKGSDGPADGNMSMEDYDI